MKDFERLKESVEGMVIFENGLTEDIPEWSKIVCVDPNGNIFAYDSDVRFDNSTFLPQWLPLDGYEKLRFIGRIDPVSVEESKKLKFNISRV